MVGPVYSLELHHALRRGWLHLGRWMYAGWLLLEVLVVFYLFLFQTFSVNRASQVYDEKMIEWIHSLLLLVIAQHFVVIYVVAPTLAAGSITDEKMRGALAHLLGTSLSSWDIIRGKWLGQMANVLILAATALPLVCVLSILAGWGPLPALAIVFTTIPAVGGLTAASLLASVWCRRTTTAILSLYAVGAAAFAALWLAGYADFFSPLHSLEPIWEGRDGAGAAKPVLEGAAAWACVIVPCLTLATWRLRPAYVRQLEARDSRRRFRWRWLERPPVSDLPVRWKERYAGELSSLPGLRLIPRRVWIVAVVVFTAASSLGIVATHRHPYTPLMNQVRAAAQLDVTSLTYGKVDQVSAGDAFLIQGVAVLLVATLVVGVRASGSVTGERERQTWEGLLLTPLEPRQLVRGKVWGIIDSARPYLLAYTIPALAVSLLAGPFAVYWMLYWWAMTWVAMYFMSGTGVEASVRSSGSWRSLLTTFGSAGRAVLSRFTLLGLACGFFVALASTAILGMAFPSAAAVRAVFFSIGCLVVAATLFSQGELLLTRAEGLIAKFERVSQEGDPRLTLPSARGSLFYRLGKLLHIPTGKRPQSASPRSPSSKRPGAEQSKG